MKMSLGKWLALKIVVGAGAVLYGFGSKLIVYLSGLRDQGGGLADIDNITVALFALASVGDGLLALGALLVTFIPDKPPAPAAPTIQPMVQKPSRVDVDLSKPRSSALAIDDLDLIHPAD